VWLLGCPSHILARTPSYYVDEEFGAFNLSRSIQQDLLKLNAPKSILAGAMAQIKLGELSPDPRQI